METFVNTGFHSHQLASIDQCKFFLKVIHLFDITTCNGQYIMRAAYNDKSEQWSSPRYEWPNQGKPGRKDWLDWRRTINSLFYITLPSLILPLSYQLKTWNKDIPNKRYHWWYNEGNIKLYMQLTDTLAQLYTTVHHWRWLVNKIYVCCNITLYNISTLIPCRMTSHRRVKSE